MLLPCEASCTNSHALTESASLVTDYCTHMIRDFAKTVSATLYLYWSRQKKKACLWLLLLPSDFACSCVYSKPCTPLAICSLLYSIFDERTPGSKSPVRVFSQSQSNSLCRTLIPLVSSRSFRACPG